MKSRTEPRAVRPARLAALLALCAALAVPAWGDGGSSDKRPSPREVAREAMARAEKAIAAEDFETAIHWLEQARKKDPKSADAENLLGYSHRKLRHFDEAFAHYEKALALDPKHRGAHEYLGRAYLETNQKRRALEVFYQLAELCPKGCPELESLGGAIGPEAARAEY